MHRHLITSTRLVSGLVFALSAATCATSQATVTLAPDQPSQPLSMIEIVGPYTGSATSAPPYSYVRLASTDPTPPGYSDFFPYRDFAVREAQVYNAQLGKNVSEITLSFRNNQWFGIYQTITFTLDPEHEIGDIERHRYNQFVHSGIPDIHVVESQYDTFYPTENRFSIVDLQRDASGAIVSLAGNFDLWGGVYRMPDKFHLSGRFWFNLDALNVPEPDTIALLLAGLATTGVIARRKAAKAC